MNTLRIKARFKIISIIIFIITYITLTTKIFRSNLIYQGIMLLAFVLNYSLKNTDRLKNLLGLVKFLIFMIFLLHTVFFIFKGISRGWDYAVTFYKERWLSIVIRVFVIPNIFAFVDILTSNISFVDLILITKNNTKTKIVYILLVSGIEVMERLRIHFEYHPLNFKETLFGKISHYLAVPLTLFFGIQRSFEKKYNTLMERDKIIKENS